MRIRKILAGIFPTGTWTRGYIESPDQRIAVAAVLPAFIMWTESTIIGALVMVGVASPWLLIQPAVMLMSMVISSVACGVVAATRPGRYTVSVLMTGSAAVVPLIVAALIWLLFRCLRTVGTMLLCRLPMAIGARLGRRFHRRVRLPRAVAKKVSP